MKCNFFNDFMSIFLLASSFKTFEKPERRQDADCRPDSESIQLNAQKGLGDVTLYGKPPVCAPA